MSEDTTEKKVEKWSWNLFFIKTICWRNIIWGVSTWFAWGVVHKSNGIDSVLNWIVVGVWGILSVILVLHKAFESAVGNAKITAELKAGAQLNAEASKVIEAVKSATNGA